MTVPVKYTIIETLHRCPLSEASLSAQMSVRKNVFIDHNVCRQCYMEVLQSAGALRHINSIYFVRKPVELTAVSDLIGLFSGLHCRFIRIAFCTKTVDESMRLFCLGCIPNGTIGAGCGFHMGGIVFLSISDFSIGIVRVHYTVFLN